MRITIDSINEVLAPLQWICISEHYSNLKSELEFRCPEGHSVFSNWERMRTKQYCPVCEQNQFKNMNTNLIPKDKSKRRTLALDQASHVTGFAIFDEQKLVKYGTYVAKETGEYKRLHEVNMWLISMIQNWQPDLIGIEGIQYQQEAGVTTFQTLGRLQGILMETCMQAKISFEICPTNTWRAHCGVKGRTRADKKKSMQLLVKDWFDVNVSDDCADAIGIGKYVSEKFMRPIVTFGEVW